MKFVLVGSHEGRMGSMRTRFNFFPPEGARGLSQLHAWKMSPPRKRRRSNLTNKPGTTARNTTDANEDKNLKLVDKLLNEYIPSGTDEKTKAELVDLLIKRAKPLKISKDLRSGVEAHFNCRSSWTQLNDRFRNVKILLNEFAKPPTEVWYLNEGDDDRCPESLYRVEFTYKPPDYLPEYSESIWLNPSAEKQAYLHLVQDHITEVTRNFRLIFNKQIHPMQKYWTDCLDCHSQLELENHHHYKIAKLLVSPEIMRRMEKNLEIISQAVTVEYNDLIVSNYRYIITKAFFQGMHNSVGRAGAIGILEFACKIAFGYDCISTGEFLIHSVGTSQFAPEGFPVGIQGDSHGLGSLRSSSDVVSPRCIHPDEGYEVKSSNNSHPHTYKDKNIIYPDLFVSATDNCSWDKYLLFCEVKSGFKEFTDSERAKLMRQLIAACLHQSQVFGLLINARAAVLMGITHDPQTKTLKCETYRWYDFKQSNDNAFSSETLNGLIYDLVLVLEYGKGKITQVRPTNLR